MTDSTRGIKIIVFMGLLVFAFLWLSSLGLKKSIEPDEQQRVEQRGAQSPVSGEAAFQQLGELVALGPRPPGSEALAHAADLVAATLRAAGVAVENHSDAPVPHLLATLPGNPSASIVVVSHLYTAEGSPGANADASGAALACELAKAMAADRHMLSTRFLFLTAPPDNAALQRIMEPWGCRAVFVLGAVGDCFLRLGTDQEAPQWMRDIFYDTAQRLAFPPHFPEQGMPLADAFGLHAWAPNTLYIADPMHGTIATHNRWHGTTEDTMEHVCPMSLQAVGDVLYHALAACDSYLTQHP